MAYSQGELGELMGNEIGESTEAGLLMSPLTEDPAMDSTNADSECFDPLNDMASNDSLIVPLDSCENHSSGAESAETKESNKSLAIKELVREVFERLHNRKSDPCTQNFKEKRNQNGSGSTNRKKHCRRKKACLGRNTKGAKWHRERRAKETPEETEFRLLHHRMLGMKARLIQRLEAPENVREERKKSLRDEVRKRRRMIRARESAEEATERKKRIRMARLRLEALETPEQKFVRKRKVALRRKELQSLKTPEDRSAVLERQRSYLKKYQHQLKDLKMTISAKTGKIYKKRPRKNSKSLAKEDASVCDDDSKLLELVS